MRMVIDEYGGVAGLVTIEDLLEAIVGSIADEHDEAEEVNEPVRETDGTFVVPGSFEVSRLRELFAEQLEAPQRPADQVEEVEAESIGEVEGRNGAPRFTLHLPQSYEATTLGGLVSEIEGRIPLAGEVVLLDPGMRVEVVASTDRRVERLRVFPPVAAEAAAS